jgi:AcrR family transcriptional regulator
MTTRAGFPQHKSLNRAPDPIETCRAPGMVRADALRRNGSNGSRTLTSVSERDRLLRATKSVLERSGWWGFKVESVLKEANLSTRSFYRHFESKNDLFLALMEWELNAGIAYLNKSTEAAQTPAAQVRAYVVAGIEMAYRDEFVKPSSLLALNWRGFMREYPDAVRNWTERMVAPLRAAIQRGIDEGCFGSSDAATDACAIFHLVCSVTADQAAQGGPTPREELVGIVLPFVTRALSLR